MTERSPEVTAPMCETVGLLLSGADACERFSVYGCNFSLDGNCGYAREGLREDFRFFAAPDAKPGFRIELTEGEPDYQAMPQCDASVYTPRNVVYFDGDDRYIDYGGAGIGVYRERERRFTITSADPHLVYEAAYLFLLSRIGESLDATGMHRLHALALSLYGKAILVLLPSGGGKSTLGTELLKHAGVQILSDDSPFIDRHGSVHAFPLRLGLRFGSETEVPPEYLRLIHRMEFGSKYLVNFGYFEKRVVERAEPGLLLLGRRTMNLRPRLEPASYAACMRAMLPSMVVGLGLYQGLEFLLERRSWNLASKVGTALSRLRNAHTLVRRSSNYVFHMGRDVRANAEALLALAETGRAGVR